MCSFFGVKCLVLLRAKHGVTGIWGLGFIGYIPWSNDCASPKPSPTPARGWYTSPMKHRLGLAFAFAFVACDKNTAAPAQPRPSAAPASASAPSAPPDAASASSQSALSGAPLALREVAFPPGTGAMALDYIVYEPKRERVWIPNARDGGRVDVFDIAKGTFARIEGLATTEKEIDGRKRTFGPSAVTIGDGVVYVGNRATAEVCVIDGKTLRLGACVKIATPTDGVVYVAPSKEVWVTSPRDKTIAVLDASKPDALRAKLTIKLDGEPEGYAVDERRRLFYTNLEDKNRTVVIDLDTHAVKATWSPGCGDDGPRGIALDVARHFVLVACTDQVRVLDGAHDGALLAKVDTGAGVDNIEYLEPKRLVYAAAGKAARLTIARLDEKGGVTIVATGTTAERARNAVVDESGNGYVVDPKVPRLLVLAAPKL